MGGVTRTLTLNATFHHFTWFNAVMLFGLPRVLSLPVALLLPQLFHWDISKDLFIYLFIYFWQRPNAETFFLYRCQTFSLFFLGRDAVKADFLPLFPVSSFL